MAKKGRRQKNRALSEYELKNLMRKAQVNSGI